MYDTLYFALFKQNYSFVQEMQFNATEIFVLRSPLTVSEKTSIDENDLCYL